MTAQNKRRFLSAFVMAWLLFTAGVAQEEEEEELPWSVDVGARYLSKYTNYGIDLGQDRAAMPFGFGISHRSGFTFSSEVVNVLGSSGGIQQSSISLEYERSLSALISLSFEFSHYFYRSDTLSALSGLSNSLSANADFDLEIVSISVFYDVYLGGSSANYFGVSASGYVSAGDVTVVPLLQVGFVSQDIQGTFLKSNRGKPKAQIGSAIQSVTGMSNASFLLVLLYPAGQGFTASFTPSFVYSPSELATRTSQFIWSVGIRYTREF